MKWPSGQKIRRNIDISTMRGHGGRRHDRPELLEDVLISTCSVTPSAGRATTAGAASVVKVWRWEVHVYAETSEPTPTRKALDAPHLVGALAHRRLIARTLPPSIVSESMLAATRPLVDHVAVVSDMEAVRSIVESGTPLNLHGSSRPRRAGARALLRPARRSLEGGDPRRPRQQVGELDEPEERRRRVSADDAETVRMKVIRGRARRVFSGRPRPRPCANRNACAEAEERLR